MTRLRIGGLAAALAALMLVGVGCADPNKQIIAGLEQDKAGLKTQLDTVREQYTAKDKENADLAAQIRARDAEIARLKSAKPVGPISTGTPTATIQGWEPLHFGDRATLESDLMFAPGKATLTKTGEAKLDKIVADLKRSYAGLPVLVYGYTDTDPIKRTKDLWTDNLDLSANRAMTVSRYLISKGISAPKVETIAMGETHPLGSKEKSRRVEIIVIKKPSTPMASPPRTPADSE